jgi:hypothetical protein
MPEYMLLLSAPDVDAAGLRSSTGPRGCGGGRNGFTNNTGH